MDIDPPTATDAVLDASALVRALVYDERDAVAWLARVETGDVRASSPDFVYLEIANALLRLVRARLIAAADASEALAAAQAVPLRTVPASDLAHAAFGVALARSLSADDAAYAVLAEATASALVTADRTLAAATAGAVLITD